MTTTQHQPAVDQAVLDEFLGRAIGDLGATISAALVVIGDRLGLYRHLADAGRPLTSAELATAAGCAERYVREWLNGQAASGYVTYAGGRYALSEEQAVAFTDESSPACVIGGFQAMLAATRAVDRLSVLFRTGEGLGWHEHHDDLFCGTERFFRPGYVANLVTSWIPALEDVEGKLRRVRDLDGFRQLAKLCGGDRVSRSGLGGQRRRLLGRRCRGFDRRRILSGGWRNARRRRGRGRCRRCCRLAWCRRA